MSIAINDDLITIRNTEPDTETVFRYRPESGRVTVGPPGETGTLVDMGSLISALQAVKRVKDNEAIRKRGSRA